MNGICVFCGSRHIRTVGGENGNPFDRRPENRVCADCGRILPGGEVLTVDLDELAAKAPALRRVIKLDGVASAAGVTRTATATSPYEDGTYSLSDCEYPLFRFGPLTVAGDTVTLGGESFLLIGESVVLTRESVAYGLDRYAWPETMTVTVSDDWVAAESPDQA